MEEGILTIRVGLALIKELERLSLKTGKSKSELTREALTAVIGVYNEQASAEAKPPVV